jgi:hypothetical protein
MPLALVVAVPTAVPSTAKLTEAPLTAAPPVVRVTVLVNVTGPTEPYETDVGLGGESVVVVEIDVGAPTASVIGRLVASWA